jgi:hypothetical protein
LLAIFVMPGIRARLWLLTYREVAGDDRKTDGFEMT